MKRLFTIMAVFVAALAGAGLMLAQGTDPFVGTWKLNLTKSKFTNTTTPKSETRTIEAQGGGLKISTEGIASDGSPISYSYTSNFDGKPVPETGAHVPNGTDMNAGKRVNSNTYTITGLKAGKIVVTARAVVSRDGKLMTVLAKGTNAKGQPDTVLNVWDKQ